MSCVTRSHSYKRKYTENTMFPSIQNQWAVMNNDC